MRGRDIVVGLGRSMPVEAFHACLRDAKIFVSPYGYGEYSWKDYESIYSGCVLVKPACDFVISHGFDIYSSGVNYVPCKPDFSDLPAVLESILAEPDKWGAFSHEARLRLEAAAREKQQRADDIAAFLNASAARAG